MRRRMPISPPGRGLLRSAGQPSAPLESRHAFERAIALHTAKFMAGAIPRPPNWTGYRLLPPDHGVLARSAVPAA
jgi:pyridoxine/pyridoxamine 5'-phosphate oxidase